MLKTQVIPIEYDEESKEEAYALKKIIEDNLLLFQAFFAGYKKISFKETIKEDVISISSIAELKESFSESIPKYVKMLQEQVYSQGQELMEVLFLKMMILDIYNAHENYNQTLAESENKEAHMNSVYSLIAASYYEYQQTPERLIDFIFEPTEEKKKEIFTWLNSRRRYDLLNHLLDEQYQLLIKREDEEEAHDPFLSQNLDEILKISEVDFIGGKLIVPKEDKTSLPSLSKEELDKLCIEFFIEIDPSLKWLKLYNKLKQEGKIIYSDSYENEKIGWSCIKTTNDTKILAPLEGSIKDFRYFIHEFAHYVSLEQIEDQETLSPAIKEFPAIFFEMYASIFLKEKGYSEEAIDTLFAERNEWTQMNMMDISPTLRYLIQTLSEGPISFEREKEKMDELTKLISNDLPEELQQLLTALLSTESDENVHIKIDNENMFLLQNPYCIVQEYPYIMGKYLAAKTLERVVEDQTLMYTILSITENLPNETPEGVIQKLGLSADEFTTPKTTQNQYVKKNPKT